jgi:S-adenosylmethionine-diacylglycerol 3-amino-3-carboxypropyl transferase
MSEAYFTKALNYTLANEDTAMELAMLPLGVDHVLSVAGSGGRVLPLFSRKPKSLTCVDVSQEQLYLTELRIESARALTHSEFCSFWGYPPRNASPEERKDLYAKIRLSADAARFTRGLFDSQNWNSVLYLGKWERTIQTLSKINQRMTGISGRKLFECLTLEEQRDYLESAFPKRAWSAVLLILGNAGIFNALLYKGHFPKKNIKDSHHGFYSKAFQHLFEQALARENYFLQLVFFGKIVFSEGCPVECKEDIFQNAKAGIDQAEIRYERGDLMEKIKASDKPIDFLSFSDVPSYFTGENERRFMQMAKSKLSSGALTVNRNYLHIPEQTDMSGFKSANSEFQAAIDAEKVGVYMVDVQRKVE